MKNLAISTELFTERNLLKSYNESQPEEAHYKKDVTLRLKIAHEMTYRVFDEFGDEQPIRNPDGSYTVTVTWPEDDWVYGFILSFGEYIEVLEPEHIKDIIKEKMLKSLKKYL